ncbi:hypothetical protein DPMN_099715 [Dreissena polymorpha]|uniref:Uncharacterized protein n=1 Tax=Dreissena polymorpha TaxID=45954 RepID=A0A9D4R6P5_DREPO|nr:hypothetical protein DPMN_099715 [Dreissena polymorpha]
MCKCRCFRCSCSRCYIPEWWYRGANGSRAKRGFAYLTITATLSLPVVFVMLVTLVI